MSRLRNVPVIPQMEEVEGGASCLAMRLGCYGKWVPLDQIRTIRVGIAKAGRSDHRACAYGGICTGL